MKMSVRVSMRVVDGYDWAQNWRVGVWPAWKHRLSALIESRTEPTCCATTESTSRSILLNSSKHPQQPD